jgi:hypothetical protein
VLIDDRLNVGRETGLVWQGRRVGVHARRIQVGAEVVTGTSFLVFSAGIGIFSYSESPSLAGGPKPALPSLRQPNRRSKSGNFGSFRSGSYKASTLRPVRTLG